MADTVFERVTGQPAEVADPVAVDLVITDETLLGGDDVAATVSGYGPIPASVARGLVSKAVIDKRSRCTLRRLYRHPKSSQLVAMESRSRFFPHRRRPGRFGYTSAKSRSTSALRWSTATPHKRDLRSYALACPINRHANGGCP